MAGAHRRPVVLATRPSALARWQTDKVQRALAAALPGLEFETLVIETRGDRTLDRPLPEIGGKGLFTQELEAALHRGSADAAVHSLKDLPIGEPDEIRIGAVLLRDDPRDVLITADGSDLAGLPPGSVLGTSSLRRRAQLLARRSDLVVRPIRGNVETRIQKVLDGEYRAVVLAAAGVRRLGLEERVSQWLSIEELLPAPGQAALAVQCRRGDRRIEELLAAVDEGRTRQAVTAERAFLAALGGGCSAPVGAHAETTPVGLYLRGIVASPDGTALVRVAGEGSEPHALGSRLAEEALASGAREVLGSA